MDDRLRCTGRRLRPRQRPDPRLNEAGNIRACVERVRWADEIVVVDSGSTDQTGTRSEDAGARVVEFEYTGGYPKKKNWALEEMNWKHEWLLILDADERISPELAREIADTLPSSALDGYYLNRRFFFLGSWIRYAGYYPFWNLRLFRHAKGRYEMPEGGAIWDRATTRSMSTCCSRARRAGCAMTCFTPPIPPRTCGSRNTSGTPAGKRPWVPAWGPWKGVRWRANAASGTSGNTSPSVRSIGRIKDLSDG